MTYFPVVSPLEIFLDLNGEPLEDGYIYIGEAYQNPITNPVTVTWDSTGLYPAAQPIRTIAGYPDRNGSPGKIFVNAGAYEDYSILIKDKNGVTNFFSQSSRFDTIASGNSVDLISDLRDINGYEQPIYVRGHTTIGDGGQDFFEWFDGMAPGTYVDDNGITIVPAGGDGSAAWIRQFKGAISIKCYGAIGDGLTTKTDNSIAIQAALNSNAKEIYAPTKDGEVYYISTGLIIDRSNITFSSDNSGLVSSGSPSLLVSEGEIAIWIQASNVTVKNVSIRYDVTITGYTFSNTGSRGIVARHPDSFGSNINDWTYINSISIEGCSISSAYMSIQFEYIYWCKVIETQTVWNLYGFILNKDQWDEFGTGSISGTTVYLERFYDRGNFGGGAYGTPVGSTGFWMAFCQGLCLNNCTTNGAEYGVYVNRATNVELIQFYQERTDYPATFLSCFGKTVIDSPYWHTLYGTPAITATYEKVFITGGLISFDATALPGGGELFDGTLGATLDVFVPPTITNGTSIVPTLSEDTEATLQFKSTKDGTWTANENLGNIEFYGSDTTLIPGVLASIRGRQGNISGTQCALVFSTGDGSTNDKEQLRLDVTGDLYPLNGATQDLGSTTYHWDNIYGQNFLSTIGITKVYGTGGGIVCGTNILYPANSGGTTVNGTNDLGSAGVQWQDIYLVNAPTVSSDERLKTDIEKISEKERRVALKAKLLLRKFRFKAAIEAKDNNQDSNEKARYHFGIIAQQLEKAFENEGLDIRAYAMFVESKDGENFKAIRYDELLAFIIAAL